MTPVKLLLAPIRRVVQFPLFQLAVTVAVILWLQAASDGSVLGQIYNGLDRLVDFTVQRCAAIFEVRSFTKSWLTTGFWIAYVYLIGLLILYVGRAVILSAVELAARHNVLFLRNAIARERGIEAYRAWLPLERIRPASIPQQQWEEQFAWPADNKRRSCIGRSASLSSTRLFFSLSPPYCRSSRPSRRSPGSPAW
jgi:hypothetical protein